MQFDEENRRPESNRKFLIKQVEEQSDWCDVKLKIGPWEKKFHACVLVASPFFDQALKSNFSEKQAGKIEMAIGTPATLEMAVMFLYGRKPSFTEGNIEQMMDLAEFLLIPNLKAACVHWVTRLNITEGNCINIIQLSSLYDLYIPECEEYFEGHLLETLQQNQSLNLTKESVQAIFLDPKLSYVPMDFKINFLVRWANANPESRMNDVFRELLETTIDLIDVSRSVLEALSKDKRLKDFIDFEEILGSPRNEHAKHRVLIMKSYSDKEFWCLDLEREKWFILTSRSYDEEWFCRNNVISGSRSTILSEIYFKNKLSSSVQLLDLETDTCKTYNFVRADGRAKVVQLLSMVENVYVVEVIEKMNVVRLNCTLFSPEVDKSSLLNYISRQRTMKSGGCCNIDMSALYIGTMDNECIEMSRIPGFEGFGISKICANKVNSLTIVAVLFKTKKHVSVFDIDNRTIETKQIKTDDSDKLERCDDGFVIYNGARCICLTNLELSTLSIKYDVKEILFENKDDSRHSKYFFRGNNWYRYYREIHQHCYQFETALHNDVISNMSFEKVEWKPLPLPRQISKLFKQHIYDLLFQISLPKSKLLCDIECPHCKFAGRATGNRESTWSSDTEDDSTDDLYSDDGSYYYSDFD